MAKSSRRGSSLVSPHPALEDLELDLLLVDLEDAAAAVDEVVGGAVGEPGDPGEDPCGVGVEADGGVGVGELYMFAAVTSWALYTILGRKVLGGLSPLAATNYAALWGTLLLGVVAAPHFDALHPLQFDWRIIVSLLYLGVLGTALAFVWYYMSVKKVGASATSIFNNLVPVFGVAISVALLGEALLPSMLIGGAIAIAGVMMVSRA
jgi:drug/metabolite transporter (DMT)-like permease